MQTILIIDDSKITSMYYSKFLKKFFGDKYKIIQAYDALEGKDMISTHNPICILCDLVMPEMDGFQFLKYLKKENINIPVIVVSGSHVDNDRERCYSLGAYAFLEKPVKYEEFCDAVQNTLKEARNENG